MQELTDRVEVAGASPLRLLRVVLVSSVTVIVVVLLGRVLITLPPWTIASICVGAMGAVALWVRLVTLVADHTLDAHPDEI